MLIQSPDIGRKLQQGLRLTSLPDSVLAPETVPVILVEDYSQPLIGTSFGCTGAVNVVAVGGEFSFITLERRPQMRCKAGRVNVSTQTNQILTIGAPTVDLTGITLSNSKSFTDFSVPGLPSSLFGFDTAVALPANVNLYLWQALAGTRYEFLLGLDLGNPDRQTGGTSLIIGCNTVNTTLTGGFDWVESEELG